MPFATLLSAQVAEWNGVVKGISFMSPFKCLYHSAICADCRAVKGISFTSPFICLLPFCHLRRYQVGKRHIIFVMICLLPLSGYYLRRQQGGKWHIIYHMSSDIKTVILVTWVRYRSCENSGVAHGFDSLGTEAA